MFLTPDNDVGKSAGRIGAVKAAFREAFTTLTGIPVPVVTSHNLSLIILISQAVRFLLP